ncbi:MAG: universal stress protein [Methyloligellaceae bacterium]
MFKSILVPIDIGHESSWSKVVPVATQLAKSDSAELHFINVVPDFGMSIVGSFFPKGHEEKMIAQAKDELAKIVSGLSLEGIDVHLHVAHGSIYEEVLSAAEKLKSDLIIVTAHRPELSDYLIGPNAARIVRHANQSVFVVRD